MFQLRLPAKRVVASSVLVFLGASSISSSALRFLEGASSVLASESDSSESSLSSESSSESDVF